ncbi:unnamed protein product, partial [Prorocentrum cordatum]
KQSPACSFWKSAARGKAGIRLGAEKMPNEGQVGRAEHEEPEGGEEEEEEEEEGLGHWAKALRHTGEHSERFLDMDGTSSPNWRSVPIEHRRGDTGHGIATAAARCRTKLTPFGGTK